MPRGIRIGHSGTILSDRTLGWVNPTTNTNGTALTLAFNEVWRGLVNEYASSSLLQTLLGTEDRYTDSDASTGTVYYYWITPVSSDHSPGSPASMRPRLYTT